MQHMLQKIPLERRLSDREFRLAVCVLLLGATALIFVSLGLIPSFGLIPD
jgi:hypothetical protein